MMSADEILLRICCRDGFSFMRNKTSVLHFRKSPKYSRTFFQYISESELAVGMNRRLGFFFWESRMMWRSMGRVCLVAILPPPMATIVLGMPQMPAYQE